MREAGCSGSIKYTFQYVMCSAAGLQLGLNRSSGDVPYFLWAGSSWKSFIWVFVSVSSALSHQKAKHCLLPTQGEKTLGGKAERDKGPRRRDHGDLSMIRIAEEAIPVWTLWWGDFRGKLREFKEVSKQCGFKEKLYWLKKDKEFMFILQQVFPAISQRRRDISHC